MQRFDVGGPFVGRAQQLERVAALVLHERLVTVVGPPGIGKSRLARLVAERAEEQWSGGAAACELSLATTAERACEVLAAAIGVALTGASTLEAAWQRIGLALAARGQTLVLLDNVDQLAPIAQDTIGRLLAVAPDAHVLATTRERLRLHAEVVCELDPLTVPESVALLVARAHASGAQLDERSPAVAAIAARLDGLPLALELAAARLVLMSPAALLERLGRRLDLLTTGMRDGAPRHSSLRAALEASWQLLSPDEQATLAQISTFPASFTLEAAEAVVQPPGATPPLDALQALVDKSLVRAPVPGGAARFSLLETIAELGREQLDASGGARAAAARHATWFAEQALRQAASFDASGEAEPLWWLDAERDNLLTAARRALAHDGAGSAVALAALVALERLAAVRGRLGEPPMLQEALRRRHEPGVEPRLVASALLARAAARRAAGELDLCVADCVEAEAVASESHERVLAARAALYRAITWQHAGRTSEATALLERARDTFAELGEGWLVGFTLGNLALLHQEHARLDEAEAAYAAALQALTAAGHRRYLLLFTGFLGTLRWEQGRLHEAQALLHSAAIGLETLGDVRFGALFLAGAAAAAAALGSFADAAQGFARAQAMLEATADTAPLAVVNILEGVLDVARARDSWRAGHEQAAARLREAARARLCQQGGGALHERSDEVRLAARLLASVLAGEDGGPPTPAPAARVSALLTVGAGGSFFVPPGGSRADLRRHRPLRLLLARLVEQRVAAPGVALPLELLVAAGWPGERIVPRAAANRVYVALTALRKLGLAGLLLRTADGYLLDPAVEVVTRVAEPPG